MSEQKSHFSLEGKLALIVASLIFAIVVIGAGIQTITGNVLLSAILATAIGIPLSILTVRNFMAPINRLLEALISGVSSLRDSDFSISIAETRPPRGERDRQFA